MVRMMNDFLRGSLLLLLCVTIIPAKQRSTEYVKDTRTRRTEQLQQGNTCGSDPVHAGSVEPAEGCAPGQPLKKEREM